MQVVPPRLTRIRAVTVWRRERSGAPVTRRRSVTEIVTVAEVVTARSGVSVTVRVVTGRPGPVSAESGTTGAGAMAAETWGLLVTGIFLHYFFVFLFLYFLFLVRGERNTSGVRRSVEREATRRSADRDSSDRDIKRRREKGGGESEREKSPALDR